MTESKAENVIVILATQIEDDDEADKRAGLWEVCLSWLEGLESLSLNELGQIDSL